MGRQSARAGRQRWRFRFFLAVYNVIGGKGAGSDPGLPGADDVPMPRLHALTIWIAPDRARDQYIIPRSGDRYAETTETGPEREERSPMNGRNKWLITGESGLFLSEGTKAADGCLLNQG